MPNLDQMINIISKVESVDITIHEERCVAVRNRNSHCHICGDACVSGCISVQENQFVVDQSKCIGCGTCATVCPTAAIEAKHPHDDDVIRYVERSIEATEGKPVFACSRLCKSQYGTYDQSVVIELPCLGRLDEFLYCSFLLRGATEINLVCADCADCPYHRGRNTIDLVIATMDALSATWGFAHHIKLTQKMPEHVKVKKRLFGGNTERIDGMSRRDFFTQLKKNVAEIAVDTVEGKISNKPSTQEDDTSLRKRIMMREDGDFSRYIPHRCEQLLNMLDHMGEAQGTSVETRLWGNVHIDLDRCNSCRMCATFCPTGALAKFDDEDGIFGIEHYPVDCVQCRLCEDICMKKCLTVSSEVALDDLMVGASRRIDMEPSGYRVNDPTRMYDRVRSLLGGGQIV
jgi:ferredoxin